MTRADQLFTRKSDAELNRLSLLKKPSGPDRLFMVRRAGKDGEGAVDLLGQEQADQVVLEGEAGEGEDAVGPDFDLGG
jgi:hypothetical protein